MPRKPRNSPFTKQERPSIAVEIRQPFFFDCASCARYWWHWSRTSACNGCGAVHTAENTMSARGIAYYRCCRAWASAPDATATFVTAQKCSVCHKLALPMVVADDRYRCALAGPLQWPDLRQIEHRRALAFRALIASSKCAFTLDHFALDGGIGSQLPRGELAWIGVAWMRANRAVGDLADGQLAEDVEHYLGIVPQSA